MLQPEQLKKRQHRLEYLKGLLKGKHTIYELLEHKFTFFVFTDKPGILYESEHNMRLWPKIVNAQPVLYTEEEIEMLKRQPNLTCMLMDFGKDNAELYHDKLAKALQEYNAKSTS